MTATGGALSDDEIRLPGLRSRVALVTGAGRGIGSAVARQLGRQGAQVAVNYRRDHDAAMATVDRIRAEGGTAIAIQGDVTVPDGCTAVVAAVTQSLGDVELLVNNVGLSLPTKVEDLTYDTWRRIHRINLDSAFLVTFAVKDAMVARRRGAIVNVSSVRAFVPTEDTLAYTTAKAALNAFTAALGRQLAPANVRVNAVAPGTTETPAFALLDDRRRDAIVSRIPVGRPAHAAEIADVICFLLSDAAAYVIGQTVLAGGGVG